MDLTNSIKYIHSDEVHNLRSPQLIVPVLLKYLSPKSIIDVGCGIGTFLSVFQAYGINDVLGVDGTWVNKEQLYINATNFIEADLEKSLNFNRKFDLAICLEVAEHLSPKAAETFISSLTQVSNTIIFSAAVPNQGGQNHINEQPFDYWQNIFAKHGFHFFDLFRPIFWENKNVEFWYKQNMFLVVHESEMLPEVISITKVKNKLTVSIHPDLYNDYVYKQLRLSKKINDIKQGKKTMSFYVGLLIRKIKVKLGF